MGSADEKPVDGGAEAYRNRRQGSRPVPSAGNRQRAVPGKGRYIGGRSRLMTDVIGDL